MSKNLTRKGLAFGALVALASSAIAGVPASAAGVDNTATLLPTTGYSEGYAVPASASQVFSLKYTTTNAAGATIKFKVVDPTAKIEPIATSGYVGRTLITLAGASDSVALAHASNTVTVTDATGAITGLEIGDVVVFSTALIFDAATDLTLAAANERYTITAVAGSTFSFVSATADAVAATSDVSTGAFTAAVTGTVKVVREKRASDNSYVIDTGVTTSSTASTRTSTIVFQSLDGADYTRSAKVTGWADDANLLNDAIDSIESTTAEREIKFVKVSEITATTSLTAPNVGDTTLAANVTTSPVLNGAQIVNNGSAIGQSDAADFVRVLFTRQDSATKWASDSASQSTDDGVWSASATMAVSTADASWSSTTKKLTAAADWGFTAPTDRSGTALTSIAITAAKVATVTTDAAHNLRTGDKVTVTVHADESDVSAAAESTAVKVTVTSATSFTYSLSETTDVTAGSDTDTVSAAFNAGTAYVVATYGSAPAYTVGRVFAGTHSAQALINTNDASTDTDEEYTATGSAASLGTSAAAAADIKFETAASSTIQGSSQKNDDDTRDAYIKADTTSATVTATVLDADGAAVGAGRSVAFTIARSTSNIKVNDKTASGTATTDANGQVVFTVTNTLGQAGDSVTINATAEGVSGSASDITLEWVAAANTLYDLNTSSASLGAARTVVAGSVQTLNLLVADQFGTVPADGTYRVRLAGAGVTEGFVDFVAGKATVKITDTKVATSIASTIALQKKNTAGTFADVDASAFVLTTTTTSAGALTLGADATALYASTTVDLSDAVAAKALVERDSRTTFTAQPAYANDVVIAGKATNSSTGANLANSLVTISGSSNFLFSNGSVDKKGSITVVANEYGEFAVTVYSQTAVTDSVITVSANGVEKTVKVTFTGVSTDAKKLTVTPSSATYVAGQTVVYNILLTDTNGNPVNTVAPAATPASAYITVSYSGPGIISGSLPVETDADGKATVRIVTGTADLESAVLTVKYDQNYDGDVLDTNDLTVVSTVPVLVVEPSAIVNVVGHRVYVKFNDAKGEEVSAVIGGVRITKTATYSGYVISKLIKKAGKVAVKAYVAGDLVKAATVTVK